MCRISNIVKKSLIRIPENAPLRTLASGVQLTDLKIKISPAEKQLFSLLKQIILGQNLHSTARVAGGWVRDKILGLDSDDIDITLDNMTGVKFSLILKKYFKNKMSRFGKIKMNPEKSKNLETATFSILGLLVDINHLRSEEYSTGSRVPQIKIGTPLEDALRRDFTLNSLFFNINTGVLEDFTEKGVADLLNWTLRTPMEPLKTFLDDPLRTIRAARFSSRFGFELSRDLVRSAKNRSVKEALIKKVSSERIGIELEKIMEKSPDKTIALNCLSEMGMYDAVFKIPFGKGFEKCFDEKDSLNDQLEKNLFCDNQKDFERISKEYMSILTKEKEVFRELINDNPLHWSFCALFLPVAHLKSRQNNKKKGEFFTMNALSAINIKKRNSKDVVERNLLVYRLLKLCSEGNINENNAGEYDKNFICSVGEWVSDAGPNWNLTVKFALVPVLNAIVVNQKIKGGFSGCFESIKERTQKFPLVVKKLNLCESYKWKKEPFYNGNDFKTLLKIPPGEVYKKIKEEMFLWRVLNPGKEKGECLEHLKRMFCE